MGHDDVVYRLNALIATAKGGEHGLRASAHDLMAADTRAVQRQFEGASGAAMPSGRCCVTRPGWPALAGTHAMHAAACG